MKGRLWLCLAVSLLCHALFFPDLLKAMMNSGAANNPAKTPARVNIKLVAKKNKEVAVVLPPPPRPKPKPRELPKPKPTRPPVAKAPPPVRPKPVPAKPAPTKPAPAPPAAAAPPRARPATSQPRASSRPARSTRRLSTTDTPAPRGKRPAVPAPAPAESQGQAGVTPPPKGESDLPIGDGDGRGDGQGDQGDGPGALPADQPIGDAPPAESPAPRTDPPAQPKADPPPQPKADPTPQPKPDRPTAPPRMRDASVTVPTIKLPGNLRRDSLKTSLVVRTVIKADGSAGFTLGDTSGNADVDDYVLDMVKKLAVTTTALDENGQPKLARKSVTVKIEVN